MLLVLLLFFSFFLFLFQYSETDQILVQYFQSLFNLNFVYLLLCRYDEHDQYKQTLVLHEVVQEVVQFLIFFSLSHTNTQTFLSFSVCKCVCVCVSLRWTDGGHITATNVSDYACMYMVWLGWVWSSKNVYIHLCVYVCVRFFFFYLSDFFQHSILNR